MEFYKKCLYAPIEIFPVGKGSNEIYNLKQHALIGVSPFNSYFTEQNLMQLIDWSLSIFEKITIFIPDTLSIFTLMALGYTKEEAEYKTRRQDNYLKNKVIRALKNLGHDENMAIELMINFTELSSNKNYQDIYNNCLIKFETCAEFKNGCLSTSSWILENSQKSAGVGEKELEIAVQYFLREFPLFLDTPTILNVKSSLFIYHKIPKYLEFLYLNEQMISPKQGYLKINFNNTAECVS